MPWLVLILLLQRKPNRTRQAWMVLVPLVLVYALSLLVDRALSAMAMDAALASSVPLGLAALWLLSYKLEPLRGARTFFAAAAILAAMGFLSAVCYSGLSPDTLTVGSALIYAVGACAIVLAMTVARLFCRKDYSPIIFMLWLLLCFGLISACVSVPAAIASIVFMSTLMDSYALFMAIPVIVAGVVGAVIGYIVLLPFMILAFRNSLYRARFNAIFRIEQIGSKPPPVTGEVGKDMTE